MNLKYTMENKNWIKELLVDVGIINKWLAEQLRGMPLLLCQSSERALHSLICIPLQNNQIC